MWLPPSTLADGPPSSPLPGKGRGLRAGGSSPPRARVFQAMAIHATVIPPTAIRPAVRQAIPGRLLPRPLTVAKAVRDGPGPGGGASIDRAFPGSRKPPSGHLARQPWGLLQGRTMRRWPAGVTGRGLPPPSPGGRCPSGHPAPGTEEVLRPTPTPHRHRKPSPGRRKHRRGLGRLEGSGPWTGPGPSSPGPTERPGASVPCGYDRLPPPETQGSRGRARLRPDLRGRATTPWIPGILRGGMATPAGSALRALRATNLRPRWSR